MVAEARLEAVCRILLCSKKCVYSPLLAEYGSFFPNNPTFRHCSFFHKGKNKGKLLQQLYRSPRLSWGNRGLFLYTQMQISFLPGRRTEPYTEQSVLQKRQTHAAHRLSGHSGIHVLPAFPLLPAAFPQPHWSSGLRYAHKQSADPPVRSRIPRCKDHHAVGAHDGT